MIQFHASWVVPVAKPPFRNGWACVEDGRVVSIGRDGADAAVSAAREVDLGAVAIMPGVVNAHTHLELSYLRRRVPPGSTFVTWVRALLAARRVHADPRAPEILQGIDDGLAEALRCGTAIVGDISNTMATYEPLRCSGLAGVVFLELIGFNPSDPSALVDGGQRTIDALASSDRVSAALAAHAPYSVAPRVFTAIRKALDRRPPSISSVHVAESMEEVEFVRTGEGPWRTLLQELGAWDPAWVAPGGTPVEYLDGCGFLGPGLLAVHGVQMGAADLARLAARGVTLVACPRSNEYTGVGKPPIAAFYESGVRVAVGTDSLASAPDLNIFAELAAMRALAPAVPACALLESATRHGADALGLGAGYGTIAPGKRARLLAVDVPPGIDDVEEYLVSGIAPGQIRWVE